MTEPTIPPIPTPEAPAGGSIGDIRERGGCLTMFLIMGVAVYVQLAAMGFGLVSLPEGQTNPNAPSWALPAAGVTGALNALLMMGIWFWKKLAVYGFVVLSLAMSVFNLATGGSPIQALAGLAGPFVLFLLTATRWNHFR